MFSQIMNNFITFSLHKINIIDQKKNLALIMYVLSILLVGRLNNFFPVNHYKDIPLLFFIFC